MEIKTDLPIYAYSKLCDHIEKRINNFQFRNSNIGLVDNKIVEIPVDKKRFDECNKLRIKLTEIKHILELDNKEKIEKDMELLLNVIKNRM